MHCFCPKQFLYKSSCITSCIIMHWKKGITTDCSVKYDLKSEYIWAVKVLFPIICNPDNMKSLLYKSSCITSAIIMHWKKGVSNDCSVKYDLKSEYLWAVKVLFLIICNPWVHCWFKSMPFIHFVRTKICTNVWLLSSSHFLPRQKTLDVVFHTDSERNSTVDHTWLQLHCVQTRCSVAQVLRAAQCVKNMKGSRTTGWSPSNR